MAAEIRDLAFTIRAIDSASATVDEIANKLRAATEGQATSVVNAQRKIAEIIARGDPAKAQALELEKQLSQLQNYAVRAKAGTGEVEAARTQIIKDFEARRSATMATGAEQAKAGFREIGQSVTTMSHLFGGASQSIVGDISKLAAGFAAGNVLGLAVAGITTLVARLSQAFTEVGEHAEKSAAAASKRWSDARLSVANQIKSLREQTETKRAAIAGEDPQIAEANRTIRRAEAAVEVARAELKNLQGQLASGGVNEFKERYALAQAAGRDVATAERTAELARSAAFEFTIARRNELEIDTTKKTSSTRVAIVRDAEGEINRIIAGMSEARALVVGNFESQQNDLAQAAGDAAWALAEEREQRIRDAADAAFDAPEIPKGEYAAAGINAGAAFARGLKSAIESEDPMDIFGALISGAGAILSIIPGLGIAGTALSALGGFFEDGGPVLPQGRNGLATINNDAIPAILHPNEFVLDAPSVSALGGIGAVESMRRDLRSPQSHNPRGRELISINAPLPVAVYRSFVGPGQARAFGDRQSGLSARAIKNAVQTPRYK